MSSNDTLPDNAWKDSFDRLLDERPVLRELCVIKRDIRASFNMNSSYENSNYENSNVLRLEQDHSICASSLEMPRNHQNRIPHKSLNLNIPRNHITNLNISTPNRSHYKSNPFKCTLSPIGSWDLLNFKNKNVAECTEAANNFGFNATPVDNAIISVEYTEENSFSSVLPKQQNKISVEASPLTLVQQKWKPKNQKQVCFATKNTNNEDKDFVKYSSDSEIHSISYKFNLPAGKWRKSLNYLRQKFLKQENELNRKSERLQFSYGQNFENAENHKSLNTANVAGHRKSILMKPNSIHTRNGSRSTYSLECNDFKRQILNRCGQRRILNFECTYSEEYLKHCRKIGEGAFGEVFLHLNQNNIHKDNKENKQKTVLKVIPIDGKELVNGETQKTFQQILPEVIISMELCSLSSEKRNINITSGFVSLKRVRCVKGKYPDYLLKLWEEYDLENVSENDHPLCFSNNQIYIILEMDFSGKDLEAFQFKNAEQTFSALQQIILTLAVGENEYQFEHRDLHWGNVLILNTNQTYISYKIGEKTLTIPSKGVKVTIIDYTLSRMTLNNYCFYNDLSTDEELFIATGDYQFEVYRMMRKVLNNKWESFEPKTNIYWISYIISKCIEGVSYKSIRSKTHLCYMDKLKELQKTVLKYKSCLDLANHI